MYGYGTPKIAKSRQRNQRLLGLDYLYYSFLGISSRKNFSVSSPCGDSLGQNQKFENLSLVCKMKHSKGIGWGFKFHIDRRELNGASGSFWLVACHDVFVPP